MTEFLAGIVVGGVIAAACCWWYNRAYFAKVDELVDAITEMAAQAPYHSPAGHEFVAADDGSDRCAKIIEGEGWTLRAPIRCRRPLFDHEVTL